MHLQFSDSVFWTSEKWVSTQVGHLLFFEKFEQTKIGGLATCPEFGKSQRTEYLSLKWLRNGRTAARWRKQIFLKFQRKFRKKEMLMTAATVEKMTCNFCSSLETFLQKWMLWFFVYFWSMNISPRRKTWREKRIGLLRFGIARKNDGVKINTFFPLGPLICLDCATVHGLRRSWSQLCIKIFNDKIVLSTDLYSLSKCRTSHKTKRLLWNLFKVQPSHSEVD